MTRLTTASTALLITIAAAIGPSSPVQQPPQRPDVAAVERPASLEHTEATFEAPTATREPVEAEPELEPEGPQGSIPTAVFLGDTAAHVIPVGVNPDGSMEIPGSVLEVGWYTLTNVRPGDPGTAVLAGHVNSRTQGRGVFYELDRLAPGDEVIVDTIDGPQVWVVTETTSYRRKALPVEEIFSLDGTPRLALITCGGEFDEEIRSFADNVVVYAELADITT